jgi:hypothetical protein
MAYNTQNYWIFWELLSAWVEHMLHVTEIVVTLRLPVSLVCPRPYNLSLPVSFPTCLPICLLSASHSQLSIVCHRPFLYSSHLHVCQASLFLSVNLTPILHASRHRLMVRWQDAESLYQGLLSKICSTSNTWYEGIGSENCCMYQTTIKKEMHWISTDLGGEGVWNDITESRGGMH